MVYPPPVSTDHPRGIRPRRGRAGAASTPASTTLFAFRGRLARRGLSGLSLSWPARAGVPIHFEGPRRRRGFVQKHRQSQSFFFSGTPPDGAHTPRYLRTHEHRPGLSSRGYPLLTVRQTRCGPAKNPGRKQRQRPGEVQNPPPPELRRERGPRAGRTKASATDVAASRIHLLRECICL